MNLVVLTGAGISAESGIATFRDGNGLWENHRVEDVATPQGYGRNPALVHRFYNARRAQLPQVQPNAGHAALAALERAWGQRGHFLLVTQNVDDLHERAGSLNLLHMHGELKQLRCTECEAVTRWEADSHPDTPCPACTLGSRNLRPDIVWFGEIPYHMERIMEALDQADIFCAIGTSGVVYPAAGFAEMAHYNGRGCKLFEINPAPTGSRLFHHVIAAPASTGMAQFMAALGLGA